MTADYVGPRSTMTFAEPDLFTDSGDGYLDYLRKIAMEDASGLLQAQESYGDSWKKRGGIGAYMGFVRKIDRLEIQIERDVENGSPYDIFAHIAMDSRGEGIIDDIRDLRRYLMLVEAEMRARGFEAEHKDNQEIHPADDEPPYAD